MKKNRRLKFGVKLILYMTIVCAASVCAFWAGREMGVQESREKYAEMQEKKALEEILQAEEKEETEEAEAETEEAEDGLYVFDPLILVNKENALPEDYEVELLTMYDKVNRAAKEAYQPLNDMLAAGRKEGLNFEICSSYRDVAKQKKLFDEDVDAWMKKGLSYEEAYEEVAQWTMPPGYSEHSTGLAFDIVALSYQLLDDGQANTAETIWLHEHCAEYGFILRYPKGKEEITHISYESWHYRYVGVEAAMYIMEHGITLEEYLEEIE